MAVMLMIVLAIGTAFIEILIFDGNIFGWTFLHFILEKENYFGYLCNNETNFSTTALNESTNSCAEQDASFSLAFTLGVSFLLFLSFPLGFLLDRFGTWIFRSFASIMFTLGYALLAISNPLTSFLVYPFLILIGVSGVGLLMSNIQLASLTESSRGSVITLLNGLFDSSIVVMFLFKKGYDAGVDPHLIFQIMTGATLFIWMRTYVFMPKKTISLTVNSSSAIYGWMEWICFKTKQDNKKTTDIALDRISTIDFETSSVEEKSSIKSIEQTISFKACLKKVYFWSNIFHFCVISFRLNFFLGNVRLWLNSFLEDDETNSSTDILGYIIMFGAVVAPLNGLVIDLLTKQQRKHTVNSRLVNMKASLVSMLITSILAIMLSVSVVIPTVIPSFILFLFARSFVYGGEAAFIALNFPFQHLGKALGLTNFVAGLVSFLQYALIKISVDADPTFRFINVGFLIFVSLSLLHPLIIYFEIRKLKTHKV